MRTVEYARYFLPPRPGRRTPYASSWLMSPEEAAERGALRQVPGTAEIRQIPETDEERARVGHNQAAGLDGVKATSRR